MAPARSLVPALLLCFVACTEDAPDPCQTVASDPSEVSCGTYLSPDPDMDPCNEASGNGPGTPACNEHMQRNAQVVTCVLQAEANGDAFVFDSQSGYIDGQYGTTSTYHVSAEGNLWRQRYDAEDLCSTRQVSIYDQVDLSTCSDWSCILGAVNAVELVKMCDAETHCEGL